MGRVAVLGASARVRAYALAGALVMPADDDDAVRDAWDHLPHDVEIVVLSPEAAFVVRERTHRPGLLVAEMGP